MTTLFWKPPHWGCQWTSSPFTIDEVKYSCAEQWMMAEKARLSKDEASLQKIMKTKSPKMMKAYGRRVAGFNAEAWDAVKEEVVYRGNMAKFGQNPGLLCRLLATKGTIAEASPYDKVWGIGLAAEDRRVADPSKWKGQNLLGKVLMKVRGDLASLPQAGGKKRKQISDFFPPSPPS